MSIFVGDIGTVLRVQAVQDGAAVDISSANASNKRIFYITKPDDDATEITRNPVFFTDGTDGYAQYVTVAGDLDIAGLWELQFWVQLTAWSGFLASLSFEVSAATSSVDSDIVADWGGSSSNSYVTLGYANGFIPKNIVNYSAWIDASVKQRVSALLQATKDIDSLTFFGERYYTQQMLEFPRNSDSPWPWNLTSYTQETNLSVEQVQMKDAVKKATCYQALFLLTNQTNSIHAQHIALGISRYYEKTGPLEEGYTYGNPQKGASTLAPTLSIDARKLLSRWITGRRIIRS